MPADSDLTLTHVAVGEGARARSIAVLARPGKGPPVVWLGGFCSDMRATKAEALDAWAREAGRALIRFDYAGHGESGGAFSDCVISTWLEDAMAILDALVPERPILVGSSMGGWIACLAARARVARGEAAPAGLVLIAPAIDFTETLMWERFPPDIRETLTRDGVWLRPTEYGREPVPITLALIEDGRRHLLLGGPLDLRCPAHILQGMEDPDVPHHHALATLDRLPKAGTVLTLIADGDHRLSRPRDIARIVAAVAEIA